MFRILIVEDIKHTLDQLESFLLETFEDSQIDRAETVVEGRQFIERADEIGYPYHAVILDFKLPKDSGENPEDDESLCDLVRRKMPQALLAHITAYSGDRVVQEHLRKTHVEQVGQNVFALSKSDVFFPNQLAERMSAYLYGTHILGKLRALFGRGAFATAGESVGRSHVRGGGGLTHEIADLCRLITAHWKELDEKTQEEIKRVFVVNVTDNIVKVGLI